MFLLHKTALKYQRINFGCKFGLRFFLTSSSLQPIKIIYFKYSLKDYGITDQRFRFILTMYLKYDPVMTLRLHSLFKKRTKESLVHSPPFLGSK
jgi:hypothetical protein